MWEFACFEFCFLTFFSLFSFVFKNGANDAKYTEFSVKKKWAFPTKLTTFQLLRYFTLFAVVILAGNEQRWTNNAAKKHGNHKVAMYLVHCKRNNSWTLMALKHNSVWPDVPQNTFRSAFQCLIVTFACVHVCMLNNKSKSQNAKNRIAALIFFLHNKSIDITY